MGATAAYGREDNNFPPAFKTMSAAINGDYPSTTTATNPFGPFTVGDPPYEPFPWGRVHPIVPIPTVPITPPIPYKPTITVASGTNIDGLFPTAKEFRELVDRVERLERRLAATAEPMNEPLRAEDV